jgi:hypothetical protein
VPEEPVTDVPNMLDESGTAEHPPFTPLIADILSSMFAHNQEVTGDLIERLTRQLAEREAEIQAIQNKVWTLCNGDYMPTSAGIVRALYPSQEEIARYLPAAAS